jgi:hypothetical protein
MISVQIARRRVMAAMIVVHALSFPGIVLADLLEPALGLRFLSIWPVFEGGIDGDQCGRLLMT